MILIIQIKSNHIIQTISTPNNNINSIAFLTCLFGSLFFLFNFILLLLYNEQKEEIGGGAPT